MRVCVFTSTQGGATFGTCRGTRRPDVTEAMGLGEDGEAASHRFLALNEPAVVAQRGCLGGQVQTSPSPHSPAEIPGCRCQRGARKSGGRGPTVPEPKVNSGQMPSSLPPGSTWKSTHPLPRRPPACRGWNILLEAGLLVLGMEFPQWAGSSEKVNRAGLARRKRSAPGARLGLPVALLASDRGPHFLQARLQRLELGVCPAGMPGQVRFWDRSNVRAVL